MGQSLNPSEFLCSTPVKQSMAFGMYILDLPYFYFKNSGNYGLIGLSWLGLSHWVPNWVQV